MKKLSDLVEIRSGYTLRSALDSFPVGDTEVIQAGDLDFHFNNLARRPQIAFSGGKQHLLRPGDVLLAARGFAKARLFTDSSTKAIASSSLFILRPKSGNVSPEFISMYFNSTIGIKAVFELSSGASVRSITKESLGKILIPEIPPDKERALGKLVQSIDDELGLIELKEIYLNSIRDTVISKTLKEAVK